MGDNFFLVGVVCELTVEGCTVGDALPPRRPAPADRRRGRRDRRRVGLAALVVGPPDHAPVEPAELIVAGRRPPRLLGAEGVVVRAGAAVAGVLPALRPDGECQAWVPPHSSQLAAEGAEAEGVGEAAAADLAGVGDALPGPRLRAAVEEHDLGAVDHVRLHVRYVDQLPHLRHPDHVVVRRPPNLDDVVVAVGGEAVGAEGVAGAAEAEEVALVLAQLRVRRARHEEARRQQRPQPRWPHVLLRLLRRRHRLAATAVVRARLHHPHHHLHHVMIYPAAAARSSRELQRVETNTNSSS